MGTMVRFGTSGGIPHIEQSWVVQSEFKMLEFALSDVEQAFRQLEFAIKLMCDCESGDLDKKKFDSDVTILLDEENVRFPDGSFQSDKEVSTASQINVGICFGVSAIVLDAAFEAAKIERNPNSRDPKDELRTLVYMVRCAFAHNFAKPCWKAKGNFARNIQLDLGENDLSIDMAALHGNDFDYSHIGGFSNWYRIREKITQPDVWKFELACFSHRWLSK
jgi:hypothetical protein